MRASEQVKNCDYFVRGRIIGAPWVLEERNSRRPYTYWKLQVIEQAKGASLAPDVDIRQPGGEIGEFGYHVAGSAKFREGEEVFVALVNTDEAAKEVVSLAAGKYTVERGENGQTQVRSGLGTIMRDPAGRPYQPDEYTELMRRLASGKASAAEQNIFINQSLTHDHDGNVDQHMDEAKAILAQQRAKSKGNPPPPPAAAPVKPEIPQNSTQESPTNSEEPKGSSHRWWITVGLVVLVLALYRIKPRR